MLDVTTPPMRDDDGGGAMATEGGVHVEATAVLLNASGTTLLLDCESRRDALADLLCEEEEVPADNTLESKSSPELDLGGMDFF